MPWLQSPIVSTVSLSPSIALCNDTLSKWTSEITSSQNQGLEPGLCLGLYSPRRSKQRGETKARPLLLLGRLARSPVSGLFAQAFVSGLLQQTATQRQQGVRPSWARAVSFFSEVASAFV